jgi:hypothetical protein
MQQQTSYIVFLCYGNDGILQECAYSLLSLSRLYSPAELAAMEIWIYTDKPQFFQSFKNCPLPLHYRQLDNEIIKQWRGNINFAHRVKIEALRELTKGKEGNILYVDSDSVFLSRIDKVLERIQAGELYMHVMEGIVSDCSNPIMKKLNNYLQKRPPQTINGTPIYDLAMWNAGVLGFHTSHSDLLDKALAFTNQEYPLLKKHVVEQFAFSVYFRETGNILAAAPYIIHYWHLKEARTVLASFFGHFKNSDWEELVTYSNLIQIPVLLQEKANFIDNRNIIEWLQKKQWRPAIHNWDDLLSQL